MEASLNIAGWSAIDRFTGGDSFTPATGKIDVGLYRVGLIVSGTGATTHAVHELFRRAVRPDVHARVATNLIEGERGLA